MAMSKLIEIHKTDEKSAKNLSLKQSSSSFPIGERGFIIEEEAGTFIVTQNVVDLLSARPSPADFLSTIQTVPCNPRKLRLMLESMRAEAEEDMRQLRMEREAEARQKAKSKRPMKFIKNLLKKFL